MYTTSILAILLAATSTIASPITKTNELTTRSEQTNSKDVFKVTNFVYGCTTTCDWSFNVTNKYNSPPGHPAFTTPVHCSGSLDTVTGFTDSSCTTISERQHVSAYINKTDNTLNLQYRVNVPSEDPRFAGAVYWYEGSKVVGAATGYKPSPPSFKVPVTKAYAIA